MANIVIPGGGFVPFPISASAGTVTVTNTISTGPLDIRFLVGGVIVQEFKLQPLEQKLVNFPSGATALAGSGPGQTITVV